MKKPERVRERHALANMLYVFVLCLFWLMPTLWIVADAASLRIAVASNFLTASKVISQEFERVSGNKVSISSGSTGKLYAQIVNGAPYDVFLAANVREPRRLVESGKALAGSRQTYAIGRLALYSNHIPLRGKQADIVLKGNAWHRLAIANPLIAPYGVAAKQVLQHLDIWQSVRGRLVRGENIGQTFYFTQSGNVDIGLVALSQIKSQPDAKKLEYCNIPQDWYRPLEQQAVILYRSKHKNEAKLFLTFLHSKRVRQLLTEKYGYGVTAD